MKCDDFLKQKFDCRWHTGLPLNEDANPCIQPSAAVHMQVRGDPVLCPYMSFSQAAVVKAAENLE